MQAKYLFLYVSIFRNILSISSVIFIFIQKRWKTMNRYVTHLTLRTSFVWWFIFYLGSFDIFFLYLASLAFLTITKNANCTNADDDAQHVLNVLQLL